MKKPLNLLKNPNLLLGCYLSHITGRVREAALHQALDADLGSLRVSGFRILGAGLGG